jgi:predicted ferric reductase
MILGIYAYVLLCDQLVLASRPAFALGALGSKGLAALHGSAPIAVIALAVAHRAIKSSLGFDLGSVQAITGAAALTAVIIASLAAAALLAKPAGRYAASVQAWRARVAARIGVNYKVARAFHGLAAVALAALFVHVLLTSSSGLSANPWGTAWLAAWTALSFFSYARYRLSGRRAGKALA